MKNLFPLVEQMTLFGTDDVPLSRALIDVILLGQSISQLLSISHSLNPCQSISSSLSINRL